MKKVRSFSNQEKANVALAAMKGEQTMAQISSEYQVHATQIGLWKKQAFARLPELFTDARKKENQIKQEHQAELDALYKIIGQRDVELDWLKKKLSPHTGWETVFTWTR